jgi:DNA-directed RNA polymerase subunit omega
MCGRAKWPTTAIQAAHNVVPAVPGSRRETSQADLSGINRLTTTACASTVSTRFLTPMLASRLTRSGLTAVAPTILEFQAEATRTVRTLRHMTTQLLQEAAQIIPNQQLLINVVSKRVRQLGLGHRPMVETTPRMSLTDIALKEIISGKLTYEALQESADGAGA